MEGLNARLVFAVVAAGCWSAFQHGYNTGVVNAPKLVMTQWLANEVLHKATTNVTNVNVTNVNMTNTNVTKTNTTITNLIDIITPITNLIDINKHDANTTKAGVPNTNANGTNGTTASPDRNEDPTVTTLWSVAVSIYCVGGMIGGVLTGVIADRFGRKGGLLLNNILVLIGVAFEASAKSAASIELFILGRLLIGVNSGLNAGLTPMYLAEISPVSLRGSICTVYQLVITITILLSQILGHKSILGTESNWPWLFAVAAVPAVIQFLMLPLCPESPKYLLLNKGQELEAQRALNWLRGDVTVHGEMEEMHQEAEKNKISKKVNVRELLSNRQLRQPLLIGVVVMIAQQLSGINAVIFYSTDIFKNSDLNEEQAQYGTIGVGVMNVVMTLVSLLLVEVAGRKTLLLTGFTGMFFSTVLLAFAMGYTSTHPWLAYACIALVVLFVIMFAVGPGSIPWFLVNELFNQSSRPAATAVAVTVNWTANFIVGLGFLPLAEIIKHYVFAIFAVIQAMCIIFMILKVPETKNKTVEEVTAMFRQRI